MTLNNRQVDSKDFLIGVLSTSALILLVGILVINAQSTPTQAGISITAGDYTMTVGGTKLPDEEFVYVIDGPAQKMCVYRFDSAQHEIQLVDGVDLAEMRKGPPVDDSKTKKTQPPKRTP